jgi:hypothetical protein
MCDLYSPETILIFHPPVLLTFDPKSALIIFVPWMGSLCVWYNESFSVKGITLQGLETTVSTDGYPDSNTSIPSTSFGYETYMIKRENQIPSPIKSYTSSTFAHLRINKPI